MMFSISKRTLLPLSLLLFWGCSTTSPTDSKSSQNEESSDSGKETITAEMIDHPVRFQGVKEVALEANQSFVIRENGTLWAVGANDQGQLGDGTTDDRSAFVQVLDQVQSVDAGPNVTAIIRNDHTLWTTGAAEGLGIDLEERNSEETTFYNISTPEQVMEKVEMAAVGFRHTMILQRDGTLWATGQNRYGVFGDSSDLSDQERYWRPAPFRVNTGVKGVYTASNTTLILRDNGSLWAAGDLSSIGVDGATSTPYKVFEKVASVAAAEFFNLFLLDDGTLWGVGSNTTGNLGDGTADDASEPVKVMEKVAKVVAGSEHALILKKDGTLLATGSNEFGQLGVVLDDNAPQHRGNPYTPTPVLVMRDVLTMGAGDFHSMVVDTKGNLYAFGDNSYGQLGEPLQEK